MCINAFYSRVTCVIKVPSSESMVAGARYRVTTIAEKISMSKDLVEN